jgi:hypothetical protein
MTYVLIKCHLTVISELKRIKRGYGSKTFSCLHVLMLMGQGRGKRFALNVVLVLCLVVRRSACSEFLYECNYV